jgi:CRISPR-associated protein Csb1
MAILTLEKLQEITRNGAAARCRVKLQPAGGEGTKVFPPTYAGAVYATEKRRLPNYADPVDCVLLDSVQSQANRMEEALQQAIDSERFERASVSLPLIVVDFTSFFPGTQRADETLRLLEPVGEVTSLQAPHRIVDAILRDSVVEEDGRPFRARAERDESVHGQRLRRVSAQNATALFELCPTALLFGMWDSTGPKGGLGVKFERAMVSELVGINAVTGVRSSSRIDPLRIQLEAGPVYQGSETQNAAWTLNPSRARQENGSPLKVGKEGKPSEINHGNIKPDLKDKRGQPFHGGVTVSSAEQTVVLSLPALRRLRFPINGEPQSRTEVDDAARTVLAALGVCAAALAAEAGLDLRSRCLLWPTAPLSWELLGKPGVEEKGLTLGADEAIGLLNESVVAARMVGLPWREDPLRLVPSDDLVRLVVRSQQLALAQAGEGGE